MHCTALLGVISARHRFRFIKLCVIRDRSNHKGCPDCWKNTTIRSANQLVNTLMRISIHHLPFVVVSSVSAGNPVDLTVVSRRAYDAVQLGRLDSKLVFALRAHQRQVARYKLQFPKLQFPGLSTYGACSSPALLPHSNLSIVLSRFLSYRPLTSPFRQFCNFMLPLRKFQCLDSSKVTNLTSPLDKPHLGAPCTLNGPWHRRHGGRH